MLPKSALCLPDFLIIGAQKAGTTWLKRNLDFHPDIFMPTRHGTSDPTEVRYFDQNFYRPLEFYSALFEPGRGKIKGDKSPNYCTLPLSRIRFIRAIIPDARLILMMRNPIERAWSHAVMNLVRLSKRRLEEVEEERFFEHFRRSRERGCYSEILDRWLSVFPREQLYVGFFEDVAEQPRRLLEEVCRHISAATPVDWEVFPYSRAFNRGVGPPIPEKYRTFLQDLYRLELDTLRRRFGSRVAAWA
ncbi:MAG: sulfotransferase [Thermoanaerobaculia bacterium]